MGFLCSYIKIISLLFLVQLCSCLKRMFRYNNTTAWEQSEFERQKSQKKYCRPRAVHIFRPPCFPNTVWWDGQNTSPLTVTWSRGRAWHKAEGVGRGGDPTNGPWALGSLTLLPPPPRRGSPGRQKIGHRWGYMAVWALLLTIFGHLEPLFANFFAIFGHFGYFLATFYLGKNLESGFWLGKALGFRTNVGQISCVPDKSASTEVGDRYPW